MSRSTLWRVLAVAMPVVAAIAAPLPSVDLTFLLRAGSEILAAGAIPTTDTWTFTAAGTPWLDQQWGSEVVLQLVFGVAGWTGLVLARAALVGLAFGLLLATVRRRAPRLGPIASALLVIAAFIVSANALALRAQLFGIVLFAATLYVLAIRVERPRAVWLIPVFSLLWANLHGTFLFAPALCGLAWLADLYDAGTSRPGGDARLRGWALHRMLIVGLVATLATLVNPFGPAVWGYVANLTSNATIAARVSEWRPPSLLTVPGALVWLSVVAVAVLALARIRAAWRARDTSAATSAPRRSGAFRSTVLIPWPALLTLALFGGFALTSGRGTAWWPFAATFVIAPWLQPGAPAGAAADGVPQARPTPPLLRRLNLTIVGALVLAGVALLPTWRPVGRAGVPDGTLTYAPQAVAGSLKGFVSQQAPCPIGNATGHKVWNPQAWGSFLEWAAPCFRYAVDSRIELFSSRTWADIDRVESAALGWQDVLAADGVEFVLTSSDGDQALASALRASGQWDELPLDPDGSIWMRRR
ncbi:MAG: hypothetical protein HY263_06410 [Chloroflexi bacterium]|nr:hypothetical protein [Chloroflexota bacterium]